MPIEFRCEACQQTLRVGDENAGTRARCPNCGNIQIVPGQSTVSRPAAPSPPPAGTPASFPPPHSGPVGEALNEPAHVNPYQSPMNQPSAASAKSRVMAPAIALLIFGGLGALFMALASVGGIIAVVEDGAEADDIGAFVMLAFLFLMQVVIVIGAIRMMMLKNYGLAMTAAVLSLLCGLGSCLALPFAIWAIIVLADSQVKAHFS